MAQRIRLKIQDVVLAFAMLMGSMTGTILCMTTIWLSKGLLPKWLETMYMLLGGVIWLGLMLVYFCLFKSEKGKRTLRIRKLWPDVLKAELWIGAVFYLRKFLEKLCASLCAPWWGNGAFRAAVSLLLTFAAVCGTVFFVHRLLSKCGLERTVKGIRGVLLSVGMLSLVIGGLWAVYYLWGWFSAKISPTVISVIVSHILMACCGYGAVQIFMAAVCRNNDRTIINSDEGIKSSGEAMLTGEPATGKSAAEKSAIGESVTRKPALENPVTGELFAEKSATGEPATEESATEESAIGESATEESATEESAIGESATGEPATGKSATGEPATEKSATGEFSTEKSATGESSAEKSATGESSREEPATGELSAEKSVTRKSAAVESILAETTTGKTTTEKSSPEEYTTTTKESIAGEKDIALQHTKAVSAGDAPSGKKTPQAPSSRGRIGNIVGIGIPLVIFTVLLLFTLDLPVGETVEDRVAAVIEESVNAGYASLAEGNLTEAGLHFAQAQARVRALESLFVEDTSKLLQAVYKEYPNDTVIAALYLSHEEALDGLEKKIRSYALGNEWYPILLRYDKEQENLTEEQELLRKEILLKCIANEQYVGKEYLFAEDVEESRLAVQRRLKDYDEDVVVCKLFGLMEKYGAEGGYTEEMAYEALELAEEYMDNTVLQYIACRVAGSYQVDGARHYERTLEAAARFDSLYDDGTRSKEQLINEKMFLGDTAARCYDYAAALAYYEASYHLSGDSNVALSCAEIHEKQKEYEQCIELADSVLQKEPDNYRALYLRAIASLKTRDLENALDAAGRLGDLVADENRKPDFEEEYYLYVCAQYLSMTDSGGTGYTWRVYDTLSEEQTAAIKEHRLLWDYMTAIYKCFTRKDYEGAAEAAENILAVRDDLSMGWYLRGTIAFSAAYADSDNADFRQILGYYEKSVECGNITPAVYYSIANVYDAMEDYENVWLYANKVDQMLPYQDHGSDAYGISVHNRNLLRAASLKLGR